MIHQLFLFIIGNIGNIVEMNNSDNENDMDLYIEDQIFERVNDSLIHDKKLFESFENIMRSYLFQNYYYIILWHMFHSFSVFYPDEPCDTLKINTKLLLNNLKNMTFCSSCSNNKKDTFVDDSNLDDVVKSRNEMITFFNDYHKYINTCILNKTTNYDSFTNDYIIQNYSNGHFSHYFEHKLNFNLVTILNDAELNERILKNNFSNLKTNCFQQFKNKKISRIIFS